MQYNPKTLSYRGKTSDNRIIDVTETEYIESLEDGIKAEAEERGWDVENLTPEQREVCENATYEQIDDPDMWSVLVGDNQNVEYV